MAAYQQRHGRPRRREGGAAGDDRPLRADGQPGGDPRHPARAQRPAGQGAGATTSPATTRSSPRCTSRGSRSWTRCRARACSSRRAATSPASGPATTTPAASTRRRPTRSCAARSALELNITKGEQDLLNPDGVNCIRSFPGQGIRIWGARTLSSDPEWRYLNVRRLFNYRREVDPGRHPVGRVRAERPEALGLGHAARSTTFLRTVWREGALFGRTPAEAFFVKCDDETNPPENRRPRRS